MPQPPSPVTQAAFSEAVTSVINSLLAASDWETITPSQRRTRWGNALDALPIIGGWLGGQFTNWYDWIVEQIGEFGGPTVPDKPPAQWFEEWWFHLFGEAITWATDPFAGTGL